MAHQKVFWTKFLGVVLTAISIVPNSPSHAQTALKPKPSQTPLDLEILRNPKGVTTADTISQNQLSLPSLWWAKENSENKLFDNWIAYPASKQEPARVDLIVNQQIWSLLDYLERYEFVNRLGSTARNYGYNVRVFNYQQELLGTYTCNFAADNPRCSIDMNAQNRFGLQRSEDSATGF
jgi:hypothetical protein